MPCSGPSEDCCHWSLSARVKAALSQGRVLPKAQEGGGEQGAGGVSQGETP